MLSIGETVEEVSDSGFLGPVPTLQVQLLVDDSLLQVYLCPHHHKCDKSWLYYYLPLLLLLVLSTLGAPCMM